MHDDGELDAGGGAEDQSPADPQPPHETVVDPTDTLVEAGELDGDSDDTTFEASDELHEEFIAESLATPLGPDGLPDHSADPVGGGALPYTIEAVTCIADKRDYVELFVEELPGRGWVQFPPTSRPANGRSEEDDWIPPAHANLHTGARLQLDVRSRFDEDGVERSRRVFQPDKIVEIWGETFAARYVPVRARREQCEHFGRQHFGLEDQPDPTQLGHNSFMLMCTHPKRRSVAGAAMRLNNEAVYGCSFRSPPDPVGTKFMDDFYQRKLDERPDLIRLPMWSASGDEVHTKDDSRPGGIFEGQ